MESLSEFLPFLDQRVDSVFYLVLLVAVATFIFGEAMWLTRKMFFPVTVPKHQMEILWSLIPALVLVFLTFVQQSHRAEKSKLNAKLESRSETSQIKLDRLSGRK